MFTSQIGLFKYLSSIYSLQAYAYSAIIDNVKGKDTEIAVLCERLPHVFLWVFIYLFIYLFIYYEVVHRVHIYIENQIYEISVLNIKSRHQISNNFVHLFPGEVVIHRMRWVCGLKSNHGRPGIMLDRQIDIYIYLYSTYKSEDSLGASVAKEMCFQRSSEGIEGLNVALHILFSFAVWRPIDTRVQWCLWEA